MPWQDEEIVRLHRMCFRLGNDRDICAGSEATEFVLIYFRDCREQFGRDSAVLEEDVSLRGSSVAKHRSLLLFQAQQQTEKFLFVAFHRRFEGTMLCDGAQALRFLIAQELFKLGSIFRI